MSEMSMNKSMNEENHRLEEMSMNKRDKDRSKR